MIKKTHREYIKFVNIYPHQNQGPVCPFLQIAERGNFHGKFGAIRFIEKKL